MPPTPSPRSGMGALPHANGTTFRVWAPHATAVSVVGTFNDWDAACHPLARDDHGRAETWSTDVVGAHPGAEYRFVLQTPAGARNRIDPRARRLTNSVGNAIVYDPAAFDWGEAEFHQPPWNDLVIYELHVGTFSDGLRGKPGTLDGVRRRLRYLQELGVGAIQLMPPFEFAGDRSWGYNTAYPFAVESTYGSPDDLKALIRDAHAAGIAVILDVVYNHLGPSDLDIWQFDGWAENGKGGIYFYEDERSTTPWGDTRPDYGRPEVRAFIRDSAIQWLEEFRVDGLRWDATAWISSVYGGGSSAPDRIEDGWRLMADINAEVAERYPGRLMIAEDLRSDLSITRSRAAGGAGFGAQWDGAFVYFVRAALIAASDDDRDIVSVVGAIDPDPSDVNAFGRVIYTESHDEDANGSARVPEEIWPGYADSWASKKRATLGSAIVLTSPGIPMLFQGQELVEGSWFNDEDGLDWTLRHRHAGLLRLHRDLIALRRNTADISRGLRGDHVRVHHVNEEATILGWYRWLEAGPRDDVIVLANFSTDAFPDYHVGVPRAGRWRVRFNSAWDGYDPEFETVDSLDAESESAEHDGMAQRISIGLGPYSVVILSQDE
ncbi:MAG: alpha-amylase family glycosyl hydrolase [Candidatus Limnocylindrales bacterium]